MPLPAVFSATDMTASIPHFISLELPWRRGAIRSSFASLRRAALIAVLAVEGVIHMAVEVASAVIPGASSNEDAAMKPLGAVVAVGRAAVGAIAVITVGARRAYTNADGDLA